MLRSRQETQDQMDRGGCRETETPEYSATRWDASVPGDMLVSCKAASRMANTKLRLR